jgi:hypothetical protein
MKAKMLIAIAFAVLFAAQAKADDLAYVGQINDDFGTLDLTTGSFTLLGNSGQTLAGMAVADGTLFASDYHDASGTLFSVNPANGALTTIGNSSVDIDDFGSTTSGLYAVGTNLDLYSINPTTGAATLIGSTGLSGFGSWRSLSTNSSTLYFANGTDLYTLNTSTGLATLVGPLGDDNEIGAMVFEDGTLYGGANEPGVTVDTIDPTTGAATTGPGVSSSFTSYFYAIAPYPIPGAAVPEPSSLAMLACGLLALAVCFKKKLQPNT